MSINSDFKTNFDRLQTLVYALGYEQNKGSVSKETSVRTQINAQIEVLGKSTLLNPELREVLKNFETRAASSIEKTDIEKLPRELEIIRKRIFETVTKEGESSSSSSSSSSSVSSSPESERKSEASAEPFMSIPTLPNVVYRQIIEYVSTEERWGGGPLSEQEKKISASRGHGLAAVNHQFRAHIDKPDFWVKAAEEYGLFGIDRENPKEAFKKRIMDDLLIYKKIFPSIKFADNVSALTRFNYYRKHAVINSNIAKLIEPKKLAGIMTAILDLNIEFPASLYSILSYYSPEVQQEVLRRSDLRDFNVQDSSQLLGALVDLMENNLNLTQHVSDLMKKYRPDEIEAHFPSLMERLSSCIKRIHSRFEELATKNRLASPTLELNRLRNENMDLLLPKLCMGCQQMPALVPLSVTLLNLFPNYPLELSFIRSLEQIAPPVLLKALETHPVRK